VGCLSQPAKRISPGVSTFQRLELGGPAGAGVSVKSEPRIRFFRSP